MTHWQPYRPTADAPWNRRRVVHLHRRAAFGATPAEIRRDTADGPAAAIDRLVQPAAETLHPLTARLASQAVATESIATLQAAWVNEMFHAVDPLREQLALMWHNHFATSNLKVQSCAAMHEHLQTLRRFARAPFGEMLSAIVKDRAMLVWLDADQNHKSHPNENLARELFELFTLGEGNYSERDVCDAARALTGWTVKDGQVRFDASRHDDGQKCILGRTGDFDTDSLLLLLIERPETAERIAWRICDHFLGPNVATQQQLAALAACLRRTGLRTGSAVERVLRSQAFFSDSMLGMRYAPPVSFVVSNLRRLGIAGRGGQDAVAPGVAAIWLRTLGQDLLQPPGVGGWPGGKSWIGTGAMTDRVRFAIQLADGKLLTSTPADGKTSRPDIARQLSSVEAQFD